VTSFRDKKMTKVNPFQWKLPSTWPTLELDAMTATKTSVLSATQNHIIPERPAIKTLPKLADTAEMK